RRLFRPRGTPLRRSSRPRCGRSGRDPGGAPRLGAEAGSNAGSKGRIQQVGSRSIRDRIEVGFKSEALAPMKIMVCIKQVPHQDARLDVRGDGTWIQEENIKFEINPYDQHALEAALQIKDAGGGEVVVVSIGPERVTQSLRTALGMGADRAIHVKDAAADGSDALGVARILAAVAKAESPDVIFT